MADLSGYTPIYVRTDGDDGTGDGSSEAPYATAQAAYDAAVAAGSGNYVLDLGVGSFGGIVLTDNWPVRIAVRGVDSEQSALGGINAHGDNQVWDYENNVQVSPPSSGYDVELVSNGSVDIGAVNTSGGNDEQDASGGSRNAGSVTLTDCTSTDNVDANGGGGVSSSSALAGDGGTVALIGCSFNAVAAMGGSQQSGNGSSGNGGAITLTDSAIDNGVVTVGGEGGPNAAGGGSAVTLTNSSCGNINTSGGSGTAAGAGGSVSLTNSAATNITTNAGQAGVQSGAGGGAVTLVNSVCNAISANGGGASNQDTDGGNGGAVSVTAGSACGDISAGGGAAATGWRVGIGGSVTISESQFGNVSAGAITLSGNMTLPATLNNVTMTDLKRGRGVNGSSILGVA